MTRSINLSFIPIKQPLPESGVSLVAWKDRSMSHCDTEGAETGIRELNSEILGYQAHSTLGLHTTLVTLFLRTGL